jgi:putative ABC transport system substrate-binding protein
VQRAILPAHLPTKFDFLVNLKAAKALDLTLLPAILARADGAIE